MRLIGCRRISNLSSLVPQIPKIYYWQTRTSLELLRKTMLDRQILWLGRESLILIGWRRGVVVTALVVSTKLLYVEPS